MSGRGSETFSHSSISKDFVRIGSKPTDKSEGNRQFDGLDLDTSTEAAVRHLFDSIDSLKSQMNKGLISVTVEPLAALSAKEQAILGWVYHPWGIQPSLASTLGVPVWVIKAIDEVDLNKPAIALDKIALTLPIASIPGLLLAAKPGYPSPTANRMHFRIAD